MHILALMMLLWQQPAAQTPFPSPYGWFTQITINTTPYGHKLQALIYQPNEVKQRPKERFPLIITFHGKSVAGKEIDKLFKDGVLEQIKEGKKIEALNHRDGKRYKFIVIAPQAQSWGLKPVNVQFMLDDILKRFPIDSSRIYVTGYSAGGWSTVMTITDNPRLSSRIAAAVPMSPAAIDARNLEQFHLVRDANIHAWYFAGTEEKFFLQNVRRYIDSTNVYKRGLTRLTVSEGFAHHSWRKFYDPGYREADGMNIYDWMIQYERKQ